MASKIQRTTKLANTKRGCQIVAVSKRRDGGTRYWCLLHRADATAKHGVRAKTCRAAHLTLEDINVLELDLNKYPGGVALWGAVPAIYDTTRMPLDKGIHVHARSSIEGGKEIDATFGAVRIVGGSNGAFEVSAMDAIYYMATSVFGFEMKQVLCTYCGYAHLDRDWFSVHPHKRHLCVACGKTFSDVAKGIGNPICGIRDACGIKSHKSEPAQKERRVRQEDYIGGIQIWGSNPAFIWTRDRSEEQGIHIHAFLEGKTCPDIDETYSRVTIDDIELDPKMVRMLMAQKALPHIQNRVKFIKCSHCGEHVFSTGELGFTPIAEHHCKQCGGIVRASGRFRKTIGNPLLGILEELAHKAPRTPQHHTLDLLPETL